MMRPAWWQDAKCRGIGCELFFPPSDPDETETPRQRYRREERAKFICRDCPVKASCLHDALATGDDGIRGGTTPSDRRRMTSPLPQRRQYDNSTDWQVVVNRPGVLNPGTIRLEQNLKEPERYRVMRNDQLISEHHGELEAWIALHKAT